jgi:hypothetical protein
LQRAQQRLTQRRLVQTRASLAVSQLGQELLPEPSLPEPQESPSMKPQLPAAVRRAEQQRARPSALSPELAAATEFPVRFRLASNCSPFIDLDHDN